MGLGKTVQTLAVLLARAALGPALVVAPTSVCTNWLREAAQFAPDLQVHGYHGAQRRELLGRLGPGRVLVTSYHLLVRDLELLQPKSFATLVLDEAQAVKNASAKRTRALRQLRAGFRVALSGTPIENHLEELWSLFSILSPGLLGSREEFRARFLTPGATAAPPARALARLLQPFLLRRTKDQVATELPPRTEILQTVALSPAERELYEDTRLAIAAQIQRQHDARATTGGASHDLRFAALAGLTRLRRLACHPRLLDPTSPIGSSKLERFIELLEPVLEGDHRALVFSQFTSYLALVRELLDQRGIAHLYLDGSTPAAERQQRVDAFQGGAAPVFLISLRAGGTGLNLTAADYVFHLDPWWNPAVEDQATDRAHRIGQDRPVTVYRLVAQRTVEEQILELQRDKRDLASQLLDDSGLVGRLDTDELLALIIGQPVTTRRA
jgi:SNF2 family DNA or RNA helicase